MESIQFTRKLIPYQPGKRPLPFYILAWAKNELEKYETSAASPKKVLRQENGFLKRIWNNGHGALECVNKTPEGLILLNSMLLSRKELEETQALLTENGFKSKSVFLGYPDYYNESLNSLYSKKINQ